ncbi:Peptidyl-prolyl cis-trans isomerase D [Eumeta japonica]|uniref:Peptidyl-prolyl cis-trans isomerase n=1 Tax=Eumeta variegata TaxID=151549 RepID=A0A4C1YRQ2_EUMVA|nr:Peptidyl-prolyl cis-trans isomerase D [Eumeta japonica]
MLFLRLLKILELFVQERKVWVFSANRCITKAQNFIRHTEGVLSMANQGRPNTNGSQFCITTVPCSHLNGRNVAFGRVLSGFGIVEEIQNCSKGDNTTPSVECVIADCGVITDRSDWGESCADGTVDTLPEYPVDYLYGRHIMVS